MFQRVNENFLTNSGAIRQLAFSPDGELLAVGGDEGIVCIVSRTKSGQWGMLIVDIYIFRRVSREIRHESFHQRVVLAPEEKLACLELVCVEGACVVCRETGGW